MAIVGKVCRELGLYESTVQNAVNGAIYPDKNPEYELRRGKRGGKFYSPVSHHKAKNKLIMKHIWRARESRLRNNYRDAAFNLGRALHYVHDRCTGKGFLGFFHDRVENKTSEIQVPIEHIQAGFNHAVSHPMAVEDLLAKIQYSNKPEEIVSRASFASAWLAKATFDQGDITKANQELQSYISKRRNAALLTLGSILVAFLTTSTSFLALPIIVLSAGLFLIGHYNSRVKKLRRWFNLH